MASLYGDVFILDTDNNSLYGTGNLNVANNISLTGTGSSGTYTALTCVQTGNLTLNLPNPSVGSDVILARNTVDVLTNKTIIDSTNTVYTNGLFTTGATVLTDNSANPSVNNVLIALSSSEAAWGQIDHTTLSNIGTNTHIQIDNHIANTNNPHSVTIDQITPTANKGELMVENGTNVVLFPTSSDGRLLSLNSATSTGLEWIDVPQSVTFVDWTTWSPASISGITALSDVESKYTRLGNMVTITTDFTIQSNITSDTVVVGSLPLPISNFSNGTKIANSLYVTEVSDRLVSFGRYLLDSSNSDQFIVQLNRWETGRWYRIQGQFSYGV